MTEEDVEGVLTGNVHLLILGKTRCLCNPLLKRGYVHEPIGGDLRVIFWSHYLTFADLISFIYVRLGASVFKEMPQEELWFVWVVSAVSKATARYDVAVYGFGSTLSVNPTKNNPSSSRSLIECTQLALIQYYTSSHLLIPLYQC